MTNESRTLGSTTTTSNYTYDAGGQVISAAHSDRPTETFTWDANGNPTGTGYVIGANNRLLEDPTYYYGYDAEGNRTSRTPKAGGAAVNYVWDNRNRLATVTTTSSSVTEKYDPLNRRIGAVPSTGNSTWFGYDGDHVVSTHQGSTVTDRFTLGTGVDEVLGQEKGGTQRWLLTDGRGSVTGTTSVSGGSTGSKTYGTFGGTQSESGVTDTLFAYTGREWDEAAGLQYSRNRWYDPSAKRWLSEDPIGFAGGDANLSRYVGNSPGTFTDPSGLQAVYIPGSSNSQPVGAHPSELERGQNYRDTPEYVLANIGPVISNLERQRAQGNLTPEQLNMLLVLINEIRSYQQLPKHSSLDYKPAARSTASEIGRALGEAADEWAQNVHDSTIALGEGLLNAILHPVDTVEGIINGLDDYLTRLRKDPRGTLQNTWNEIAKNPGKTLTDFAVGTIFGVGATSRVPGGTSPRVPAKKPKRNSSTISAPTQPGGVLQTEIPVGPMISGDTITGPFKPAPVKPTATGTGHSKERHGPNRSNKYKNKSLFDLDSDIDTVLRESNAFPAKKAHNSNRVTVFESSVEGTSGGVRTKTMTVVTKPDGTVITAHPGTPYDWNTPGVYK